MPIGLKFPVQVDKSGGAALEFEPQQIDKLIKLALSEGGDLNPFQDLGLPGNIIFEVNDTATITSIRIKIEQILTKFEDRIVIPEDFDIELTTENEQLFLEFSYLDLNNNELVDYQLNLSDGENG